MDEVKNMKSVNTPAEEYLFMVNSNSTNLDTEKTETNHTTIATSLCLCKRAGPDVQPTVSLLCTRVKVPNKDDWKKSLIMINYFQETRYDDLILKINDMTISYWYSDTVFEVHTDM